MHWPYTRIAHVGDSRVYIFRDGQAIRLTEDHTLANAMRRNPAKFPLQEASLYEYVLLNTIGGDNESARIDLSHHTLEVGDTLMVCSDGLVSKVTDAEMADLASRHSAACLSEALTLLAVERGVRDNVTVASMHLDYALPTAAAIGARQ